MTIQVEPHWCPFHQFILITQGPFPELSRKNIENRRNWKTQLFESVSLNFLLIFFCFITSHLVYVATSTESNGVKIRVIGKHFFETLWFFFHITIHKKNEQEVFTWLKNLITGKKIVSKIFEKKNFFIFHYWGGGAFSLHFWNLQKIWW